MKVYFIDKFSEGDAEAQAEAMRKYCELTPPEEADIIYCGSIAKMQTATVVQELTKKPLATFCWDYYLWAHNGVQQNFNWKRYQQFLNTCDLVFVPSTTQQKRLKELLNVDSIVVHSGVTVFDHEVSDQGFILDPVRYYPEENRDWAEKAAKELGIPFVHSEHQFTFEEYKKLVATCTFMTSCFREASTGGLSLVEGLYLGKPSLISNSPYQGANDYVGEFATKFQFDDYEDLVDKMSFMWKNRVQLDTATTRKYIKQNFTYDLMSKKICEHFKRLLKERSST